MELEIRSGTQAEPERISNGAQDPERSTGLRQSARKQERSLGRARSERERSTGPQKEHGTPKGRSESRNYIISKPHKLLSFLKKLNQ